MFSWSPRTSNTIACFGSAVLLAACSGPSGGAAQAGTPPIDRSSVKTYAAQCVVTSHVDGVSGRAWGQAACDALADEMRSQLGVDVALLETGDPRLLEAGRKTFALICTIEPGTDGGFHLVCALRAFLPDAPDLPTYAQLYGADPWLVQADDVAALFQGLDARKSLAKAVATVIKY